MIALRQRVQNLVDGCRTRIGGRGDGGHDTHRTCDLGDAFFAVLAQHAHGDRALQVADQAKGLAEVLVELVIGVAKPGILHRKLGEQPIAAGLKNRPGRGRDQQIDLPLIPRRDLGLGNACTPDQLLHA